MVDNSQSELSPGLAVVIGINRYARVSALRSAVNDARVIAQTLTEQHGYDVVTLLDEEAGYAALFDLLTHELPQRVSADTRLLVYFAGHGVSLDYDDSGPGGFLVPQDASPDDRDTMLDMRFLHDALVALPCRHLLLVLDCCFAGSFRWATTRNLVVATEQLYRRRYERYLAYPAWQVLTSASHDQRALDLVDGHRLGVRADGNHSPFAAALLRGLAGAADWSGIGHRPDGVVTASELHIYLRDEIEDDTSQSQTPGLWPFEQHGRGEYLFRVPGAELDLRPDPILDADANPWPGLAAYSEDDREVFFGRTELIDALHQRLRGIEDGGEPLLTVVGASGSGKSSLVRAGLLPRLRGEPWAIAGPVRPGSQPLDAFTTAEAAWTEQTDRRLLFVDQFEELYVRCRDAAEREQALAHLRTHLHAGVVVLITVRSDFLPQLLSDPQLAQRVRTGRFPVSEPSIEELREIVVRPAQARVMYFEPSEIVDRCVQEVVGMPGALPLISYFLSEMYNAHLERNADDRELSESDFEAAGGGVIGAVHKKADALLASFTQSERHTCKNLFLRLVSVDGGKLTRRRVALNQLGAADPAENARLERVRQALVDARLLSQSTNAAPRREQAASSLRYVEPTHDTLITGWQQMIEWLGEAGETFAIRRDLANDARSWVAAERPAHALWDGKPKLSLARELASYDRHALNMFEAEFVRASDRRETRKRRRNRGIAVAMVLILLVVSGVFVVQAQQAAAQDRELVVQTQQAAALDRELVVRTQQAAVRDRELVESLQESRSSTIALAAMGLRDTDPVQAFRAAEMGLHEDPANKSLIPVLYQTYFGSRPFLVQTIDLPRPIDPQTGEPKSGELQGVPNDAVFAPAGTGYLVALDDHAYLIGEHGEARASWAHDDGVMSVAFSPDGQLMLSATGHAVWRLEPGGKRSRLITLEAEVNIERIRLAGAPDTGLFLLIAHRGPQGERVDIRDMSQPDTSLHTGLSATAAALSYDGAWFALANEGKIAVRATADRSVLHELSWTQEPPPSEFTNIAFAPDGSHVVAAADGQIGIWNLDDDGEPTCTEEAHEGDINSIRFAAHDGRFVTASDDGRAIVWSLNCESRRRIEHPYTYESSVRVPTRTNLVDAAWFSADGRTVVTALFDGTLRTWFLGGGVRVQFERSPSAMTWTRDSRSLLVFFDTGTGVRVELGEQPLAVEQFAVDVGAVRSVAESPDGAELLLGTDEGHLRRMTYGGTEVWSQEAHGDAIPNCTYSADGRYFASAGLDGDAHIWTADGQPLATVSHRLENGDKAKIWTVEFLPDNERVLTGGYDGFARLWSNDGTAIRAYRGGNEIQAARIGPTPSHVTTAGMDEHSGDDVPHVKTFRIEDGTLIRTETFDSRFSVGNLGTRVGAQSATVLLVSDQVGTRDLVRLWDHDGTLLVDLDVEDVMPYPDALQYSPDGRYAAIELESGVYVIPVHLAELSAIVDATGMPSLNEETRKKLGF